MSMESRLFLVAFCAVVAGLSGCVTVTPEPLADGKRGFVIGNCDDVLECRKKAAETCRGKYQVLNESNGSIGSVSTAGGMVSTTMVSQYTMTIRCDSADVHTEQAKSRANS